MNIPNIDTMTPDEVKKMCEKNDWAYVQLNDKILVFQTKKDFDDFMFDVERHNLVRR